MSHCTATFGPPFQRFIRFLDHHVLGLPALLSSYAQWFSCFRSFEALAWLTNHSLRFPGVFYSKKDVWDVQFCVIVAVNLCGPPLVSPEGGSYDVTVHGVSHGRAWAPNTGMRSNWNSCVVRSFRTRGIHRDSVQHVYTQFCYKNYARSRPKSYKIMKT
jgi:hypothetical protein